MAEQAKTYGEVRRETETARNALIEEMGIFFAFNQEQFNEGASKVTLAADDYLEKMWGGGFIAASKVNAFIAAEKAICANERGQIKKYKLEESEVLYELANHEAFYVGDIEDTVDALDGKGYSREFITAVYRSNYARYCAEW
jgi:hypothetical protein